MTEHLFDYRMDRLFAVDPAPNTSIPRPLSERDKETGRRGLLRARAALAAKRDFNASRTVAA